MLYIQCPHVYIGILVYAWGLLALILICYNSYKIFLSMRSYSIAMYSSIFPAQNFHKFCNKIFLHENIIMNITAYSVIIFFDTCLIHEFHFEAFCGNLVPRIYSIECDVSTRLNVMCIVICIIQTHIYMCS